MRLLVAAEDITTVARFSSSFYLAMSCTDVLVKGIKFREERHLLEKLFVQ
jgi:hypothetical protein